MSLHVDTPVVTTASDLEELRRNVQTAFRRLCTQINSYKQARTLDVNKQRVTGVANPSAGSDAVNLQTLRDEMRRGAFGIGGRPNQTIINNTNTIDGSAQSRIVEFTLASATTTITATSPVEGELLSVYIVQDATGGREIEWSSDFNLATVEIPSGANKRSIFHFFARSDNKWWPNSVPYLES